MNEKAKPQIKNHVAGIGVGALVATIVTPWIEQWLGPDLFGVQQAGAFTMLCSTIATWLGQKKWGA